MLVYMLQLLAWIVVMAVLILWPAGTLVYPAGWTLIGVFAFGGLAMILWLAKYSPSLLRERMASPVQRAQAPWDRVWLGSFTLAFCLWIALISWDAGQTDFRAVPAWLQGLGLLAILANGLGTWWTFRENAFAAPVVKIQAGQKVIDSGPYAFVRHPMYASAVFLFLGIPLWLGSWVGLVLSFGFIAAIAWRAVHEEEVLRADLPGYAAYAARVRYRLFPYVW